MSDQDQLVFDDIDESFELAGIKVEDNMDDNLKQAIEKYNQVHANFVGDLESK